jgi:hypothetical protein
MNAINLTQEFKMDNDAVLQANDPRIAEIHREYANIAQKLREQIHAEPVPLN